MKPWNASAQRGVAALEAAFVLVPLMLIFVAVSSLGYFFLLKQNISHAAGEGARALVSAAMRQDADPGARACAAAWSALGGMTSWLEANEGPMCRVEALCDPPGARPCMARLAVGYPAESGSALHAALERFGSLLSEDESEAGALSRLLGAQVSAQVMTPFPPFSGRAP